MCLHVRSAHCWRRSLHVRILSASASACACYNSEILSGGAVACLSEALFLRFPSVPYATKMLCMMPTCRHERLPRTPHPRVPTTYPRTHHVPAYPSPDATGGAEGGREGGSEDGTWRAPGKRNRWCTGFRVGVFQIFTHVHSRPHHPDFCSGIYDCRLCASCSGCAGRVVHMAPTAERSSGCKSVMHCRMHQRCPQEINHAAAYHLHCATCPCG